MTLWRPKVPYLAQNVIYTLFSFLVSEPLMYSGSLTLSCIWGSFVYKIKLNFLLSTSLMSIWLFNQPKKKIRGRKGEVFSFSIGRTIHHLHISENLFKYGHSKNVVFGGELTMQIIWKARHYLTGKPGGRIRAATEWENLGTSKFLEGRSSSYKPVACRPYVAHRCVFG